MIVCIGSINVDFIFAADRWPTEHEKYRAKDYICVGGGSAANTACELSRLGKRVAIVGGLGNDDLAVIALNSLTSNGVNVDHVIRRNNWKTGCAAVRSTRESKSMVTAGAIDSDVVLASLDTLKFDQGDHIHFSWAPPQSAHGLLRKWRRMGISLSWETNGRMNMPTAELMDIIFMNGDEKKIYQHEGVLTDTWMNAIDHGVTVVVTLGSTGAETYFKGQYFFCRAREVHVVDRTGGGDAFDAGFVAAWLDKRSVELCLKCGLESAAIIIGQLGPQYRSHS